MAEKQNNRSQGDVCPGIVVLWSQVSNTSLANLYWRLDSLGLFPIHFFSSKKSHLLENGVASNYQPGQLKWPSKTSSRECHPFPGRQPFRSTAHLEGSCPLNLEYTVFLLAQVRMKMPSLRLWSTQTWLSGSRLR